MVEYTCKKCNKVFNRKYNYEVHISKKFDCSIKYQVVNNRVAGIINNSTNLPNIPPNAEIFPPNAEISPPISSFIPPIDVIDVKHHNKCNICNKKFTRSDNYKRHMMFRCKFTIEPIKENNKVIELLTEMNHKIENLQIKNNELQNTILELKEQKSSITTNTNSHNTTNNTINNNVIIKFGDEDAKSILSKKDIQYIVDAHKEYLLQRSIEVTHCNNKYPSLQNIYVPDKKMQMINIFNGENYELKNIETVIMDLITTHQNNLDDYRRMKDIKIDRNKREDMDEYVDNFHRFNESSSDHKKQLYDSVLNDVKLILYNNKDKIKETEKSLKKKQKN